MLLLLACVATPTDTAGDSAVPPHKGQAEVTLPASAAHPDVDGDGFGPDEDCNDANPAIFPGAEESCNDQDDDCDGEADEGLGTTWFVDEDGDGWGTTPFVACDRGDGADVDGDCDDLDAAVHPEATDRCNDLDDDCDGEIDESGGYTRYTDDDGDGWGGTLFYSCDPDAGVSAPFDCDDSDGSVSPSADEACNGHDDDCDGETDEAGGPTWYTDADADGYGVDPFVACDGGGAATVAGDCDDNNAAISPGSAEACNGQDDDCDGATDESGGATWYVDADRDGVGSTPYVACDPGAGVSTGGDCDDLDATMSPLATESCNGHDDDCDGETDEAGGSTWFTDADGDGWGDLPFVDCDPSGGVEVAGDCDDTDGGVFPGAPETCNDLDDDCNGAVDEAGGATWYTDGDRDGVGDVPYVACDPGDGVTTDGDCDDSDDTVLPGADERCDTVDNDCDGFVDEDDSVDQPTWHVDRDEDGYGDPTSALGACTQPAGWIADASDCDDLRDDCHPGAPEALDGHDNDCDGTDAGPCVLTAASTEVLLGDDVTIDVTCAGVDEGQPFTLTDLPTGATWDDGARQLTWTPTNGDLGAHTFLVADDDESVAVTINVQDSDQVVFNLEEMHRVDITISSAEMAAINANPKDWQEVDFSFDGEAFTSVGVRATGRLGSARDFPSKVAMKVDLNKFGVDQALHGLQRLDLHNMVQDCAKVKELAAYGAHRLLGTPAPRVAYTEVYVNGTNYGVYSVVEEYDDEFLEKNFADPTGNLYDGDYYLYPDWSSYILVDFMVSSQGYFQQDEGTDIGMADIEAVTAAMRTGDFEADVAALVDLDQHAAFFAANAWTGQYDSYSYYRNNYRVYFDPGRGGKAVFLPWDPDWAFYVSTPLGAPYGIISAACFGTPSCRAAASAYADQLSAEIPGGALQDEMEAAIDLINPYLTVDPKVESSMSTIRTCQTDMLSWFAHRSADLDAVGF